MTHGVVHSTCFSPYSSAGRDSEIPLGKQAEDGCTLFCANFKPCFFSLSLYVCHGKNLFRFAHQQDAKALIQLFEKNSLPQHLV